VHVWSAFFWLTKDETNEGEIKIIIVVKYRIVERKRIIS